MMTITFMIGDVCMCEGYSTTEFITDDHGLTILHGFIEELLWSDCEYIVLKDGVPYKWNLYLGWGG